MCGKPWENNSGLHATVPNRLILCLGILTFLAGCAARTARGPLASPKPANSDYIDIQAGWRLTVVTPILKSGGYVLKSLDQQSNGGAVALSAGSDLIGYEVAHYAVKEQKKRRVRVEFSSAELTKDGKTEPQQQPVAALFQIAGRPTYLRLIYLVRASNADHNMVVVAASRLEALDTITRQVEANPIAGCRAGREAACSWIPEGIAVRPEMVKTVGGVERWVDASN